MTREQDKEIEAETILLNLTEKLLWYADEHGAIFAPQIRALVAEASRPLEKE